MRVCPTCFGLYGPDRGKCPKDGTDTEDSTQVLIGRTLGSYMIRAVIGEGGMGVVYSAEHTTIGRRVALKVLRPELSLRDDIVERFIQEARAVNTIGHANIVNIYDFGKTPYGSCYIVMEHLDGRTIRNIIDEEGPLPLYRARQVVQGVGTALAAAHSKGFIHRDVKPENIMVMDTKSLSHIKLLDFGIAKLLTDDRGPHTHTGSAMGTPQYMCPEQLEDAHFDHRADIYALAAVTYEMITGAPPYPGKSHAEVRQLQLTRTPAPPSLARPEANISRKLDASILWALNPDVAARCSRIEDFLAAFDAGFEVREDPTAKSGPRSQERPRSAARTAVFGVVLGLAALLVGGGIMVHFLRKDGGAPTTGVDGSVAVVSPDARVMKRMIPNEQEAQRIALEKIRAAFASAEASEREQVTGFLAQVGKPVMLEELKRALHDSRPTVRRAAARALGKIGSKQAIGELRRALKESVGYIAWDVAGALAQLGDETGLKRLRKDLKGLNRPLDVFKRKYILHILGQLKDPSAKAWKKLIGEQRQMVNPALNRKVLGYLAALGDRKAHQQLVQILNSAQWPTRIEAAEALAPTDQQLARKTLRQALNQTTGKHRLKAARLLANFGDATVAEILLEFLASTDPEMRQEGAIALGQLPGEISSRPLRAALNDQVKGVALAAAVAFVRAKTKTN